jgi:hypothetical protein
MTLNSGMRNLVMGVRAEGGSQYEIFDADDESQSSSHSGSGGSSVGTCYDDAPSDDFEDNGRNGELAFGERIY